MNVALHVYMFVNALIYWREKVTLFCLRRVQVRCSMLLQLAALRGVVELPLLTAEDKGTVAARAYRRPAPAHSHFGGEALAAEAPLGSPL